MEERSSVVEGIRILVVVVDMEVAVNTTEEDHNCCCAAEHHSRFGQDSRTCLRVRISKLW